MRALSNAELLDVWDAGQMQGPVARALSLLVAATPEESAEALALLPIGERDRRLMELRAAMFGPELPMLAKCPACAEMLECSATVAELLSLTGGAGVSPAFRGSEAEGGRDARPPDRFRLPNSVDLAAVAHLDPADAPRALLERCIVDGGPLTEENAISEAMARLDPLADLDIALTCAACGYAWSAPFDIADYLWAEIQAFALRLMMEVHLLARAYAWSEREILALPARRRRAYLELVG